MAKRDKVPYGYIYRATNMVNGKVYEGQTVASRWTEGQNPIEGRWKEEVGEAYRKQARGENLRYIENAIIKYGPDNFELTQQDIAYSREELDEKETKYIHEYDSTNPDKGYNLKEGGLGGRLSDQAKENVSKAISDKYQNDPEYYEKQLSERQERAVNNPEWHQKMTEINRERAKDPQWKEKMSQVGKSKWQEKEYNEKQSKERQERAINNPEWHQKMTEINQEIARNRKVQEKMSKALSEKWQGQKYQESVSEGVKEKWKDEKYRERQARAKAEGKREIPDKEQFLKDISEMMKKDINAKYDMDGKSINKRIEDMLKHQGVRTYSEAKKYLEDKNIKDVVKDIEENAKENQPKPSSEKETPKNKEEPKPQEKIKDNPEVDKKKDEKEKNSEKSEDGDKAIKPENGEDTIGKGETQEVSEEKTKGENTSEEVAGEEQKLDEPDYAGIDEDSSKESDIEKESDIGSILETTPGSGIKYDVHNKEIKESKEKSPKRKDGEVPKLTSDPGKISSATEKRLATPPRSTEKEGKHKDLAGLNLNLNLAISGGGELFSGGGGGDGGGDAPDYDGIDAETREDEEKSEGEGEGGSEGKERSWEA